MFLSKELVRIPAFSSKWLYRSFAFLIVGQFLDGVTTKNSIELGLNEDGTYAKPKNGTHGK
jgi:hypothetical protein